MCVAEVHEGSRSEVVIVLSFPHNASGASRIPTLYYIRSDEIKSARAIRDECAKLVTELEAFSEQQRRILIDESLFYRALSPEKFRISTDRSSKSVTVW